MMAATAGSYPAASAYAGAADSYRAMFALCTAERVSLPVVIKGIDIPDFSDPRRRKVNK